MLKTYSFLLSPEALPSGGCRMTMTQTHSHMSDYLYPVEAPTEDEALRDAVVFLEHLVIRFLGWEMLGIRPESSIRKTSFGAYHVVFEADI